MPSPNNSMLRLPSILIHIFELADELGIIITIMISLCANLVEDF